MTIKQTDEKELEGVEAITMGREEHIRGPCKSCHPQAWGDLAMGVSWGSYSRGVLCLRHSEELSVFIW